MRSLPTDQTLAIHVLWKEGKMDQHIVVTYNASGEERALLHAVLGDEVSLTFLGELSPAQRARALQHTTILLSWNFPREILPSDYASLRRVTFIQLVTASADNLKQALIAIGLRAPAVPAAFNCWINTPYTSDGTLAWQPTVSKAGDYLVFRPELDCVVAMSACPQDLVPVNGSECVPKDLEFEVSAG